MSANVTGEYIDPTLRISRGVDMELLRKICSNVMIGCSSDNSDNLQMTVSQMRSEFLDKFRLLYDSQMDILDSYTSTVSKYYAVYDEISKLIGEGKPIDINEITRRIHSSQSPSLPMRMRLHDHGDSSLTNPILSELSHNIRHYEDLIVAQKKVVESRLTVYKRYEKIVQVIEEASKRQKLDVSDATTEIDFDSSCPICADSLKSVIALYDCGHFFCKACSDIWRKSSDLCVCCRAKTPDDKVTIIKNDSISAYGTKIGYIIDLIKRSAPDEQFVIFTQFESSIRYMVSILNKEGVTSSVYTNWFSIKDFKENSKKAIILSSVNQPSGLDLSFVSNIIMIEPLNGEFSFRRDIEKQIISRIHRIKQTKDINVYRLIIRNTIEEQLYVDL
jgi:SNF2 family DNA or RNA helicase